MHPLAQVLPVLVDLVLANWEGILAIRARYSDNGPCGFATFPSILP